MGCYHPGVRDHTKFNSSLQQNNKDFTFESSMHQHVCSSLLVLQEYHLEIPKCILNMASPAISRDNDDLCYYH